MVKIYKKFMKIDEIFQNFVEKITQEDAKEQKKKIKIKSHEIKSPNINIGEQPHSTI